MNAQNISSLVFGSLALAGWYALWRYAKRTTDPKRMYIAALVRAGLTPLCIMHLDDEDWVGFGEASVKADGSVVRFNTNRRPDGTIRLMLSSANGISFPQAVLPEQTLVI